MSKEHWCYSCNKGTQSLLMCMSVTTSCWIILLNGVCVGLTECVPFFRQSIGSPIVFSWCCDWLWPRCWWPIDVVATLMNTAEALPFSSELDIPVDLILTFAHLPSCSLQPGETQTRKKEKRQVLSFKIFLPRRQLECVASEMIATIYRE